VSDVPFDEETEETLKKEGVLAEDLDEEEEEPLWDQDARAAMVEMLSEARWDPHNKTVTVIDPYDPDPRGDATEVTCRTLAELEDVLCNAAETAFSGSVPCDGGEEVFTLEVDDLLYEVLFAGENLEHLKKMGWEKGDGSDARVVE
jgi:hypothetical protein